MNDGELLRRRAPQLYPGKPRLREDRGFWHLGDAVYEAVRVSEEIARLTTRRDRLVALLQESGVADELVAGAIEAGRPRGSAFWMPGMFERPSAS